MSGSGDYVLVDDLIDLNLDAPPEYQEHTGPTQASSDEDTGIEPADVMKEIWHAIRATYNAIISDAESRGYHARDNEVIDSCHKVLRRMQRALQEVGQFVIRLPPEYRRETADLLVYIVRGAATERDEFHAATITNLGPHTPYDHIRTMHRALVLKCHVQLVKCTRQLGHLEYVQHVQGPSVESALRYALGGSQAQILSVARQMNMSFNNLLSRYVRSLTSVDIGAEGLLEMYNSQYNAVFDDLCRRNLQNNTG